MPARVRPHRLIGFAIALLMGVVATYALPSLPPREWTLAAVLLIGVMAWRWPVLRFVAWLALGSAWAIWQGSAAMQARLPHALEGVDLRVTGRVAALPQRREEAVRFVFVIDAAERAGEPLDWHGRVRLSWHQPSMPVPPCSRWQLTVRLKRPRGLVNPGGFDGERTALAQGITAAGYVRQADNDAMQGTSAFCIDGVRQAIVDGIAARVADRRDAATLQAFAVGDTRGLSGSDWDIARANGVPHLVAISGFHVGVAALAGVWLARLFYLLWPGFGLRLPRACAEALLALLVALAYGCLAGLGLATLRTLLMIAVIALARGSRRTVGGATSLALALVVMLVFDPLAALSPGFWLSFVGVALLMFCLATRHAGWRGWLRELLQAQVVMTIALLPLTLGFFGQASLVGLVSNLVAIPVVTLLVVPATLLGIVLLGCCPPLASLWLAWLGQIMHALWWLFEQLATWPGARFALPAPSPWAWPLAMLGAVWLFAPRGVPLRLLAPMLFLPLALPAIPRPGQGGFDVWMLDVGQGLSVFVRTREHTLLFDAGASFPGDASLGDAVVVPALHALGVSRLDRFVISHADNDHAGGAAAVRRAFPHAAVSTGEPERLPFPAPLCRSGERWEWEGVSFRFIHPPAVASVSGNDRSCVLLVEGAGGALVLGGDVTMRIEAQMLAAFPRPRPTILLMPHHGSRTSSSEAFLVAAKPTLALVSAGWRNRFGHPHPKVIERYEALRIPWLNTADSGAVRIEVSAEGLPRPATRWRVDRPRYWRE